ncbi:MAG TPA: hypothetical protein VFN48_06250 [Solirubrobacteraceae bacterium]|nr:hypothetical protein [Solirubrobacteraceae bacterium]
MNALWRRYGGGPAHLLATLASFAIATAAVVGWAQSPSDFVGVLEWFAAAIVLHDLVLLPLYSLVDRVGVGWLPARHAGWVRIPALISLLVLAGTFPTVLGFGARSAHNLSGLPQGGYLVRWLVLAGALFALSGLAFVLGGRAQRPEPGPADR